MNERQIHLVHVVLDMLNSTAEMMEKDPFYAPPKWIIENWWHTLNATLKLNHGFDSVSEP